MNKSIEKLFKKLESEENPFVYFSNALNGQLQGVNIAEAIYFISKVPKLFSTMKMTEDSEEILKNDVLLNDIVNKMGD